MKKPFVTLEQLQNITAQYPTPFHLYDEKGIRENARRLKAAFAWNPCSQGHPKSCHPEAPPGGGLRRGLLLPYGTDAL